ncbi:MULTISPECIES: hypothetical protein [unclassified Bradyrhizobium]|uniref:hypothetical protein n=1 Tax=unclassified Bradyrhizobium TaxID=2631580 RepID=UPI0024E1021E|nr:MULTISPECIES: hypothetical protein [unclassified Bradyrhizobium]
MSKWIVSSGHEPHRADRIGISNTGSRQAGRWKPPVQVTGAALLLALASSPSLGRDRGQYANSSPEMKAWFDGLRSGKGPCCSDADGSAVSDVDWETKGGHYRVRIEGEWLDVPDEAVITEPNRVGRTMVWPMRGYQGLSIRCFMPGSMT